MSRTKRIWQRIKHPETLPYIHTCIHPYASDKRKVSNINRIWKIRNRWWRTLRYGNKVKCKDVVKNVIDPDEVNTDVKGSYTEFFD